MERIKIGDNGHKKLTLKQRLVRYLLRDAHIDELHIGAHSIVIDGDVIRMSALATDPVTPAEGWIWHLAGTTHKPRFHNGTEVKDVGEGATPGAHKASHQATGGDELDLTGMKADSLVEKTAAAGVNIDACLIKDGKAANSNLLEGSNKATVQDHTPKAHLLGAHTTDTLASLNAKVTDATLDDSSATRTPASHDRTKHSDIDQSLLQADNVVFAQVTLGDLVLKNEWRFTEHEKHGVVLQSPKGELYRLAVNKC